MGGILGTDTTRKGGGGVRCRPNSKKVSLRCWSDQQVGYLPLHIHVLDIYVSAPVEPSNVKMPLYVKR